MNELTTSLLCKFYGKIMDRERRAHAAQNWADFLKCHEYNRRLYDVIRMRGEV